MIFHFRHTLSTVSGHINRILLLINLHNLRLLLDSGIRRRVEASLHVGANRIWVRIHSLVLLTPTLNVNWLIQRHLLRTFVLMRLMPFLKLRFNLRNALHTGTSWQNDGATLSWNLITLLSNLLRSLKPVFPLRILLTIEHQPTSWRPNLRSVMQRTDRIISGTFKLILIWLITLLFWRLTSTLLFTLIEVLGVFITPFARKLSGVVWHAHEALLVANAAGDAGLVFELGVVVVHHLHILWHILLSLCLLLLRSQLRTITRYRTKGILLFIFFMILDISDLSQLGLG